MDNYSFVPREHDKRAIVSGAPDAEILIALLPSDFNWYNIQILMPHIRHSVVNKIQIIT